jgi:hypothetical protein
LLEEIKLLRRQLTDYNFDPRVTNEERENLIRERAKYRFDNREKIEAYILKRKQDLEEEEKKNRNRQFDTPMNLFDDNNFDFEESKRQFAKRSRERSERNLRFLKRREVERRRKAERREEEDHYSDDFEEDDNGRRRRKSGKKSAKKTKKSIKVSRKSKRKSRRKNSKRKSKSRRKNSRRKNSRRRM